MTTFEWYNGDTFILPLQMFDGNIPHDLTGETVHFIISAKRTSEVISVTSVTTHTDAANGETQLRIEPATLDLEEGEYWLTCVHEDAAGDEETIDVYKLQRINRTQVTA